MLASTRTNAIRLGVTKSWQVKSAELGFFSRSFEYNLRDYFYSFFNQSVVAGAGVALSGLLLHRFPSFFIAEAFLQDVRILDWFGTYPGFRLGAINGRERRFEEERKKAAASRAKSLSVESSKKSVTPVNKKKLSVPVLKEWEFEKSSARLLGRKFIRSKIAGARALSPLVTRLRLGGKAALQDIIERFARSGDDSLKFSSPLISHYYVLSRFTFYRRRQISSLPFFKNAYLFVKKARVNFKAKMALRERRHVRYLRRRGRYRRLRQILARARYKELANVRRLSQRSPYYKRLFPHSIKQLRRFFPKAVLEKRRLEREERRRARYQHSQTQGRFSGRRRSEKTYTPRVRVIPEPTIHHLPDFYYRFPLFCRSRLLALFARLASFFTYKSIGVPVVVRINVCGHWGTTDFYLNYITSKLHYRYILNDVIAPIVRISLRRYRGYRIICSGRFTRAQMASRRIYRRGSLGVANFSASLEYAQRAVTLKYGVCNIKLWIRY